MTKYELKPVSSTPFLDEDSDSRDDMKEQIVDWFYENFEDPSEHMPKDTETGKYEWIWGGPFDARDEIEDAFIAFDADLIDEAIDDLGFATDWAPHIDRVVALSDAEVQAASYEDLQSRVQELELLLGRIQPRPAGIGGNNPPEEIGLPPYDEVDDRELKEALASLKRPQDELTRDAAGYSQATEAVKSKADALAGFLARHGEKFASGFSEQMGKRAADSITVATWMSVSGALYAVYAAAKAFVLSIGQLNLPLQ